MRTNPYQRLPVLLYSLVLLTVNHLSGQVNSPVPSVFRAASATSNITPPLGTSTNGYFQDILITKIHDETHARCLVLDDGKTQLAIVLADLCVLMRQTADLAKKRASDMTGIPVNNILIAATHTHSGGTSCPVFQSDPDPGYLEFLNHRLADAIVRAYANLQPARIGWGFGAEPNQVFCRRWKMKEGTSLPNPFGGQDQVKMNPGIRNPNLLEPTGPVDPELPLVVIQSLDGEYIGLLANYSLHYVGFVPAGEVSADYFAVFANRMEQLLGAQRQKNPFVGIMSNGTSGDINNIDFSGRQLQATQTYVQMEYVANRLSAEAFKVIQQIKYHDWVPLDAVQTEINLGVRRPVPKEVERAKAIIAKAESPIMKSMEEVYARETLLLEGYPETVSVPLQVLRIGSLAIAAIPCEPFAEIGLELKERSPFADMFTISLANAYHGYLPTPAQHTLGGYETWRARSSYLEIGASPKVIATLLELMNRLK